MLTRGPTSEDGPRVELDVPAVPYLVQANLEHWREQAKGGDLQESRPRLKLCRRVLHRARESGISVDELWSLLYKPPVWERGVTLYCCVMKIEQGELLARSEKQTGARHSSNSTKQKPAKRNKKNK